MGDGENLPFPNPDKNAVKSSIWSFVTQMSIFATNPFMNKKTGGKMF